MKKLGFDLIVLGAPTAGKDTQANIIRSRYLLKPVESGKQWRLMAKKNNREGRWLQRTFGKGHPAPVQLVKKFLLKNIKNAPKDRNLIFIGNPRLKPEAQYLVKLLNERGRDFFVIYLTLPEKDIKLRSTRRSRDAQDVKYVQNRINFHKKQVSKTIKYFESLGKLKVIKGNQSIKKVAGDIDKAINDYARSKRN
jgi:adenylate kinase